MPKYRQPGHFRHDLPQQFETLRHEVRIDGCQPCHITPGPRKVRRQPQTHLVCAGRHHNWNRARGALGGNGGGGAAGDNHGDLELDQLFRQAGECIKTAFRVTLFETYVAPFDIAEFA